MQFRTGLFGVDLPAFRLKIREDFAEELMDVVVNDALRVGVGLFADGGSGEGEPHFHPGAGFVVEGEEVVQELLEILEGVAGVGEVTEAFFGLLVELFGGEGQELFAGGEVVADGAA